MSLLVGLVECRLSPVVLANRLIDRPLRLNALRPPELQ